MKIILFIDSLGAGGAQRQFVGLSVLLKEKGYNVKVATYYDIDFYKKQLDDANVINELIPGADHSKKRILAVRSYFKKEQPDWVIAYQETPSLVACAAKLLGCNFKLLVSERNTTQKVGLNERVRFFLYRWANAIVPNSYAQERWLKAHHPWMSRKITTITNFVDLKKFHYTEHHRRPIPEIIVAATIWPSKNTLGLIDAIEQLKQNNIKCHFSWYGRAEAYIDYFNECTQRIKEYDLEDYIELLPKTKEINRKYQNADYFCLPSFYEGTPNVLCEAISCGLPVIVSDVCDNSLYAERRKNGDLFDPLDSSSIANTITRMLSIDEVEYQQYCKHSRIIAEEKLSTELFVNKYIKVLNDE